MDKEVRIIVPIKNGYLVMPFDMQMLLPLEGNRQGVLTAESAQDLGELVESLYTSPEEERCEN